jgi:hypothetical protein
VATTAVTTTAATATATTTVATFFTTFNSFENKPQELILLESLI